MSGFRSTRFVRFGPDFLAANLNASMGEPLRVVANAESEPELEPHRQADHLRRITSGGNLCRLNEIARILPAPHLLWRE